MPPIRTIVIAGFVVAIMFFAMVNFMGSFLLANNTPIPNNIKGFYDNLSVTNSTSGVYRLSAQGQLFATQLGNGNIVAGTGTVIGMVASLFGILPGMVGSFINFTAVELALIGIPTAFAVAAAWGLLVILMALGIISAVFIFGI